MELWDAYDENFNLIEGIVLERGKPVPEGLYHIVADILVQHTDGSYLIMKRDPRKLFGGTWQASAGGSALRGETPLACAERELLEETGIRGTMSEVGRDRVPGKLYVEFLCITDQDKQSVTLQEGETVDFRWLSKDELFSMPTHGPNSLSTERIFRFLPALQRR